MMLPFLNMRMYRNNSMINNKALEKMKKGELTVEDILNENELVIDVKTNPSSQFSSLFTTDNIKKLIDYITIMPESDELNIGYKYPFNACEILQSENSFILDKIFESVVQTEAEEELKRKMSNMSSEMYKDDLSIEESEESGEEENLHQHNTHDDQGVRETESKNGKAMEIQKEEKEKDFENYVDYLKENVDDSPNHPEENKSTESASTQQPDKVIVTDEDDEDVLNEIGKKIQSLEITIEQANNENVCEEQKHASESESNEIKIEMQENKVSKNEVDNIENEEVSEKQEVKGNNEEQKSQTLCEEKGEEIIRGVTDEVVTTGIESKVETAEVTDINEKLEQIEQNVSEVSPTEGVTITSDIITNVETKVETESPEGHMDGIRGSTSPIIEPISNFNTEHDSIDEVKENIQDNNATENFQNTEVNLEADSNQSHEIIISPPEVVEENNDHKTEDNPKEQNEEERDPGDNVRHKTIPRHKKHHSQRHEFLTEDNEEDIFNISNENLQHSEHIETPVKEVKIKFELIDYFFNFLKSKGDLNCVLAGYFAKIFNHIMSLKNITLLKYIFTQKIEVIDHLIINSNRKSISECLLKILLSPTEDLKSGNQIKIEIIDKIIDSITNDGDEERVENLVYVLIDLIGNKLFSTVFLRNLSLLKKLHQMTSYVLNDPTYNSTNIPTDLLNILNKTNENIMKEFGPYAVTPQAQKEPDFMTYNNLDNNEEIMEHVEVFDLSKNLDSIVNLLIESGLVIAKNYSNVNENSEIVKTLNSTYNRQQKVFGSKRLAQFEFLKSIFEILLNVYASESYSALEKIENYFECLIEVKFFMVSIEYFYEYEFNNFYQKSFEHLMILICNKHTPGRLLRHIFGANEGNQDEPEKENYLSIILDKCQNSLKFIFDSGMKINSGHFAITLEICEHITKSENQILSHLINNNKKFRWFCHTVVNQVLNRFNQGLLYDINSNKVILDKLNCLGENEYSERTNKEQEYTQQSNPSLNQILNDSYNYFNNNEIIEMQTGEDGDIYAKINPIELIANTNPFESKEDKNWEYSDNHYEDNQGEIVAHEIYYEGKVVFDNHMEMENEEAQNVCEKLGNHSVNHIEGEVKNIFEIRTSKMNERYFSNSEEDEIKDIDLMIDCDEIMIEENVTKVDYSAGIPKVDESTNVTITFYDNNYWKSNIFSHDEIMKDLDDCI